MPQTPVQTPSGEVVTIQHPEGATEEQILEFALQQYTPSEPEPYLDQVTRRYSEADFAGTVGEFQPEFQRRLATQAMQIPGVPGSGEIGVSDVAATAVSQAARTAGAVTVEAIMPLVPNSVREWFSEKLTAAGESVESFLATDLGKEAMLAASNGYDAWQNFSNNNRAFVAQLGENLGTGADLLTLFSPRPDLSKIDIKFENHVRSARAAGIRSSQTKERMAIQNMLEPETLDASAKERKNMVGTFIWEPNDFEEAMINVVDGIPGIKHYGPVRQNFRIMQDHIEDQATVLERYIKGQNKNIVPEDLLGEFSSALDTFMNSDVYQLASKQAQKQFIAFTDLALKVIKEEGTDLNGLLRARRRFDKAAHAAGAPLDGDVATYQAQAARLVRGVMNDYLKRNTKGDEVHHLLDQQHRTLSALDNLVNKRNREGKNAIERALGIVRQQTGVSMSRTAVGVLATASAVVQPAIAATVGAAVGLGLIGRTIKRHGKSATLKAYAELLSGINKTIKTVNNPTTLEALELDRLIIIDLMNEVRNYEESEDNG